MSTTEGCWLSLDGNKSQLVHVNEAGLSAVNHTSDVVVTIHQRLERGGDPTSIPEIAGRIP
jgi:hypothetical protein